jgi:hypothetical protein
LSSECSDALKIFLLASKPYANISSRHIARENKTKQSDGVVQLPIGKIYIGKLKAFFGGDKVFSSSLKKLDRLENDQRVPYTCTPRSYFHNKTEKWWLKQQLSTLKRKPEEIKEPSPKRLKAKDTTMDLF